MMNERMIMTGVTLVLVVGIVCSIIFIRNGHQFDGRKWTLATLCKSTDYRVACMNSLGSFAHADNATLKDIIHAAIDVTLAELDGIDEMANIALLDEHNDDSNFLMANNDDPYIQDAMNCKELIGFSRDELHASLSLVQRNESKSMTVIDLAAELNNWLSAVISYQETCLDGLKDEQIKKAFSTGVTNFTQLASNALSIITQISNNFTSLDTQLMTNHRKLLEATTEVSNGGYPAWLSAADRKLLENHDEGHVKPDVTVAKDASGQFKTIADALAAYRKRGGEGRFVIYVKAGIYPESVTVDKDMVGIFMYGDGPQLTIVTGWRTRQIGYPILETATFSAVGKGFIAKSMGFRNTAGQKANLAVALRVQSDLSAFVNCRIDGYQNTLFAQAHRQFYRDCIISGTTDIIFGDSAAFIQNSVIIVRKPLNPEQKMAITAQARADRWETTGFVIQNCRIAPEKKLYPVRFDTNFYLGRPLKDYSRTIIMESTLGDFIRQEGWMGQDGEEDGPKLEKLFYAEYANRGPGADTSGRVKWKSYKVIIDRTEALQYTAGAFIQGALWLNQTTAPFVLGLKDSDMSKPLFGQGKV